MDNKIKIFTLSAILLLTAAASSFAQTYTAKDIIRLQAFADAGDPDAMNELGVVYGNGLNNKSIDNNTAIEYLEKAIKLGCVPAMIDLSGIYFTEKMTSEYSSAIKLLEKAVASGNLIGYLNLGFAYDDGLGVPKNLKLAEKYLLIAAKANYPTAQFDLGYFYVYSLKAKYKESYSWFNKAALNGYKNAYSYLALYYIYGLVYKKDMAKAYMYAKYAELIGAQGGKKTVDLLVLPKITPAEKAEGEKLLKEYIAKHPINND